eukprot:g20827.t1
MEEGDPGVIHFIEFRMGRPKCEGDAKEGGGMDESIVGHGSDRADAGSRGKGVIRGIRYKCDGYRGVQGDRVEGMF